MNTNIVESDVDARSGEYLTFVLADEEYGIEILKVQEIRGYDTVTKIANTPEFIKGVINLRGSIVPIVDLRILFHLGTVEYNQFTVVIILNISNRIMGIVVDGVSDVLSIDSSQIRPVPDLVTTISTKYLLGLGTVNDHMLILVDINQLMTSQELEIVDSTAQ